MSHSAWSMPLEIAVLIGPAAIKRAAMDRLPVKTTRGSGSCPTSTAHLQRAGGAGLGVVLEHLAPADDSGIGGDLDEDPGVLEDEGLNFGDFDFVVRSDRSGRRSARA